MQKIEKGDDDVMEMEDAGWRDRDPGESIK